MYLTTCLATAQPVRNRVSLVNAETSTSVPAMSVRVAYTRYPTRHGKPSLGVLQHSGSRSLRRSYARPGIVQARQTRQDQEQYSNYDYGPPPPREPPNWKPGGNGDGNPSFNSAFLAAAFVLGIGTGVAFDSNVNFEPDNVASREIIDRQSPSAELCFANGASAMVFDERLFVSFNPFNVYVAQPEVKPGCVLRRSNWSVLESRKLVNKEMVSDCKRNVNTFAFVGDLDQEPEVSCVYHSEDAENQFMKDPRSAALGDGQQPRRSRDFK